jgi:F-box/leucine-rich repeat protein 2/20
MTNIKGKVRAPKSPSNIARKLLFRKREDGIESLVSNRVETPIVASELGDVGSGCFTPWRGDSKARRYNTTAVSFSNLNLDVGLPVYPRPHDGFKGKARSYSSPLPLSSLDLIPIVTPAVYEPIPAVVRNYFEEFPKELRLQVLSSLVTLHEAEYQRWVREGQWTVLKASSRKNEWVGKDRGIRELIKFSRVSGRSPSCIAMF